MSVRILGKDLHALQEDDDFWGDGYVEEEFLVDYRGKEFDWDEVPETTVVSIMSGWVIFPDPDAEDEKKEPLADFVQRWLDERNSATIVVKVPKDHDDKARARILNQISRLGGEIVN